MRLERRGFTLIELVIVLVIVGILAAIAFPMMSGNLEKARKSEAVAALGTIRTAERLYFVDNQTYTNVTDFTSNSHNLSAYLKPADLNGQFYNAASYSVSGAGLTAFTTTASNALTAAPQSAKINSYSNVTMNQDGTITGF